MKSQMRLKRTSGSVGAPGSNPWGDPARVAPDATSREDVLHQLLLGHEATVQATGAVAIELESLDIEK
jgi:hypothetical protein